MKIDEKETISSKYELSYLKTTSLRKKMQSIMNIFTGGLFTLVSRRYPSFSRMQYTSAKELSDATHVLIKNIESKQIQVEPIRKELMKTSFIGKEKMRTFFTNIGKTFVFSERQKVWKAIRNDFYFHWKKEKFRNLEVGLEERIKYQKVFGENATDVPIPSVWIIMLEELFSPYILYQIFSIFQYVANDYLKYGVVMLLLMGYYFFITIKEIRNGFQKINSLASFLSTETLLTGEKVSSRILVPGDEIIVKSGVIFPADLLLVGGSAVANESSLTGESAPVPKMPFNPQNELSFSNVLLSGTLCMSAEHAKAVVVRTSFNTYKGDMIRAILLNEARELKMNKDVFIFIFLFVCISLIAGLIYAFIKIASGIEPFIAIVRGLELVIAAVPSILPLALTASCSASLERLKEKDVWTFDMDKIALAGRLKMIAFDKTGTLTKNDLDFKSFLSIKSGLKRRFFRESKHPSCLTGTSEHKILEAMSCCHSLFYLDGLVEGDPLEVSMFEASKAVIMPRDDQMRSFGVVDVIKLRQNPLPKPSSFRKSSYPQVVEQNDDDEGESFNRKSQIERSPLVKLLMDKYPESLVVVRNIEFCTFRKRQSVIVVDTGKGTMELFVKGAWDSIVSLSDPESLPSDIKEQALRYASKGYRIIGLGCKKVTEEDLHRPAQELETNLNFIGLLFFENTLKQDAAETISTLRKIGIRCLMITGDDQMTGVAMARESLLLDHARVFAVTTSPDLKVTLLHQTEAPQSDIPLKDIIEKAREECEAGGAVTSLTGAAFDEVCSRPELSFLIKHCIVFSRANPSQKATIVRTLSEIFPNFVKKQFMVGFCGDGANDCAALKAAHVGFSIGKNEASLAAPFNTGSEGIGPILSLVREGKSALKTVIQIFQFVSIYGVLQFLCVLTTYSFDQEMSNGAYYMIDLILTFIFTFWIIDIRALEQDTSLYPTSTLMSPANLSFFISQSIFVGCYYWFLSLFLKYRTSFMSIEFLERDYLKPKEEFGCEWIFCYFSMLSLVAVIGFLVLDGYPFKQSWLKNKAYCAYFATVLLLNFVFFFNEILIQDSFIHQLLIPGVMRIGHLSFGDRISFFTSLLLFSFGVCLIGKAFVPLMSRKFSGKDLNIFK